MPQATSDISDISDPSDTLSTSASLASRFRSGDGHARWVETVLTVASSALMARRLCTGARPNRWAVAAMTVLPGAHAAMSFGLDQMMVTEARPVFEEELPEWYTSLHADLLVWYRSQSHTPKATYIVRDGLDLMVVNEAFLFAAPATQAAVFNAALDKRSPHRGVEAVLDTGIVVSGLVHRRLLLGNRRRVSLSRALLYVVTSRMRVAALNRAKTQALALIARPHQRAMPTDI